MTCGISSVQKLVSMFRCAVALKVLNVRGKKNWVVCSLINTNQTLFLQLHQNISGTNRFYAVVKRMCAEYGIISQFIHEKHTGFKMKKEITGSCIRQIMTKAGNIPWELRFSLVDNRDLLTRHTLIIGIDVNHDRSNNKSTAAFVMAHGQSYTQYDTLVATQAMGREMLEDAGELMNMALQKYRGIYKQYPTNIVVFRDGVSNSQLDTVFRVEVDAMQKAIEAVCGDPPPALTTLVVQKRVKAKFVDERGASPAPGTVVDTDAVSSQYWDFYLITNRPPRGCCATPTRYIVIKDDAGFSSDDIQKLVHQLSHLYYNWCGPIRVPAVVQSAHRTAHLYGSVIKPARRLLNLHLQAGKHILMNITCK
eukprot:TRINITY_DN2229_c0_g1_i1.p1 TRINITY_DN2229_c0_g1~~TRINITY_DN2229_c0_g1_i1.p1  ORF type:complete len:365 (+),score=59.15 TRINITY_DN2229_c0_g1_i1:264-1358(+)